MDPAKIVATDTAWTAELARRHDAGQGAGAWQRLLPAIAADIAVQPLLGPRELHRIDAPTMVVVGDRDPFAPVDHAWGLSRQIPRARLFVAPDCGHEVTVRRPGLFNEATAGFYRQTEAEARRRADALEGEDGIRAVAPTAGPVTDEPDPASLAHPTAPEIPGTDDTDARWLDQRSEGEPP
jgi:hypothetical protein